MKRSSIIAVFLLLWMAPSVRAQHHMHADTTQHRTRQHRTTHADTNATHHHHGAGSITMRGMLGDYAMHREASGTSWQPELSPMEGRHAMRGKWMLMVHGFADLIYDHQGGRRGGDKVFSTNMLMLMAQRPLGGGTFGFRGMLSLEPATIGDHGYPLLLQTGETADGKTPLVNRQHPHDLLMELAGTYSVPVSEHGAAFAYFGMPGEPALGPPAFMHRFSGVDNPEAPITHHWLDSTHITFGVAALGLILHDWKVEGSVFTGREPDEQRWDFDKATFDSYSGRVSWNPTPAWAFQASYGALESPEQLEPEIDTGRATASASYHRKSTRSHWQTTFAWGLNEHSPGNSLHGVLLETALRLDETHTWFGRVERVEKDELFREGQPLHGETFRVGKLSVGYIYDYPDWPWLSLGFGGLASLHFLSDRLEDFYGDTPGSVMLFVRAKLRG